MRKSAFSTLVDLAGLTALVVGFWWLTPAAGMIVLGIGLLVIGWSIDPPKRPTPEPFPGLEEMEPEAPQSAVAPPPGLDWNPN